MAKNTKKTKKKQETAAQQTSQYLMSVFTAIYVFCMLCIFPLYYDNKYYNMGDAKYTFFKYVSLVLLSALLIGAVFWLAARQKEMSSRDILKNMSHTDWFAVAFFAMSYFSFLFSEYKGTALWGYSGWFMGVLSQFAFVVIFFLVSRFWNWSPTTLGIALITAAITYQLGIWHRFLIDPLGMYINLDAVYIEKFVSTLGQTTWFSSYAVLIFPIGAFYYCYDDKVWSRVLSGIFCALAYGVLATTNSDSAYIAFLLVLMVFFWYGLESNEKFLRFWELVLIGLFSFRVIGVCRILFPEKQITLITGDEAITAFVTRSKFMLVVLVVVAVLYFALRHWLKPDNGNGKKAKEKRKEKLPDIRAFQWLRKVMVWVAVLLLWLVLLLMILTTNGKLPGFLQGLYEIPFFQFNDEWGNHRGFNWRMALTAFFQSSFKDMLFGVGPDCFAHSMDKYCMEEVAAYWNGLQLACAHNEWLNLLVTQGILGLVSYVGIFVTLVWRLGKVAYREPAAIPFMAATLAYMGHNIFCYQQCICTPVVFILMGIGEMIIRQSKKGA